MCANRCDPTTSAAATLEYSTCIRTSQCLLVTCRSPLTFKDALHGKTQDKTRRPRGTTSCLPSGRLDSRRRPHSSTAHLHRLQLTHRRSRGDDAMHRKHKGDYEYSYVCTVLQWPCALRKHSPCLIGRPLISLSASLDGRSFS